MSFVTFQDYKTFSVRSAAILTNSYVAGTVIGPAPIANPAGALPVSSPGIELTSENQIVVLVKFTIGSLTDARIKLEFSNDGSTYYQETFATISTGTETDYLGEHVFTASGNYRIPVQLKDKYLKISAIGTGTLTSSSMTIDTVIGVA